MKLFGRLFVLVFCSVFVFVSDAYAAESRPQTIVVLSQKDTVNRDYFAAGDSVTVSGTVNGDAYIAGGNVVVDGTVNGDLLVVGGVITIRGTVKNDIRAAGGNLTIAGPVGGNVTLGGGNTNITSDGSIAGSLLAGAGNLEVLGPIGKGVTAGIGNLNINAAIGGDLMLGTGQLTVGPKAKIAKSITYWSENKAIVMDEKSVVGDLIYHSMPRAESKPAFTTKQGAKAVASAVMGLAAIAGGIGVIALFLLGLVVLSVVPVLSEKTVSEMKKNPWSSFGMGIITTLALPFLAVVLFMTVIGIPVGIALGITLGILCLMGHVYGALFIGRGIIITSLHAETHRAWHLFGGLIVLAILGFIPILGWLARMVFVLLGVGALITVTYAVYKDLQRKKLV